MKSNRHGFGLLLFIVLLFVIILILSVFVIKGSKQEEKPMRAVMLINGKIIECEIEDYEILHNLSGEMAKIKSKDGNTYYTNSFKIIDGEV